MKFSSLSLYLSIYLCVCAHGRTQAWFLCIFIYVNFLSVGMRSSHSQLKNLHLLFRQKQPSPEPGSRRELIGRHETLSNGRRSGSSHASEHLGFSMLSPKSPDFDDNEEEEEEEHESDLLDRR